jgi:hypothetical protein
MNPFSEPGIAQAMQQHGGRNRSLVPKRQEPELLVVLSVADVALVPSAEPTVEVQRPVTAVSGR